MEKDIVWKLNREFVARIESERQVVYILVELRKLLEKKDVLEDYRTLKFCSDWAAHPKLNFASAQFIVELFDKYEDKYRREGVGVSQAGMPELSDFLNHTRLRDQIIQACDRHGVSTDAIRNDDTWRSFLAQFTEVVKDCPLEAKADNTKYVEWVTAHAVPKELAAVIMPNKQFGIQWTWGRKDIKTPNVVMSFF